VTCIQHLLESLLCGFDFQFASFGHFPLPDRETIIPDKVSKSRRIGEILFLF
jgi:hypothetical protein